MNIIFGNFGNQTIALMQWVFEQQLTDVYVISVDTGWAAKHWQQRVNQAQTLAKQFNFEVVRLSSTASFAELVKDRQAFPSIKFQWCAGFLKGLAFNAWLDEYDPQAQARILLGKRKLDSRMNRYLQPCIEQSEHYGNRTVAHPLLETSEEDFQQLIANTGLEYLTHRSLECDPCIHSQGQELINLHPQDLQKTAELEKTIGEQMFIVPIAELVNNTKDQQQTLHRSQDMGCGSPFACGE